MLETGPPSTIDHEGQETEPDTEETEETEELKESGETEEVEDDTGAEVQVILQAQQEGRRTKLPVPVSGEEVSLWAVLRKNVGKDLSTVSFPVTFNEPLSLLQKLAEDLEYADLLIKAVAASDPVERMCLVAAFAVSTYASSHYRAARKPFNPMLGETFEDIRPSSRFVAEKVSHHPPVMASYAEGEGWTYWATSGGKNKFWGRSLEIIPTGTTHLKIGENHYQWQKPSSFMRNLMAGQKYVEHVGQMTISDAFSDLSCVLDFKDSGFWGSSRNAVSGSVRSSDGAMVATVEGAWHESFSRQLDVDMLSVLWRANQMPQHAEQYYGFTTFAMQLNELLPSNRAFLPPTDSRLRPDQRALEEGRVDEAEVEKLRLEQEQRQRRKEREDLGKSWEPRWFSRVPGPSGLGEEWVYKGGYWETRAKKMWDNPGLW
ncbi:Oxysterol-binding protein [Dacryopinax primogenitus]|uniref:Oxysterol-binding protein n=1 Tax=Dacryopinax primogenitus (strain DJM 731) TaxID=1858805 RepID=M5G584_DACPD|nr:Oxysterol-binding protein [Dacryopinax primogenitus]EJT98917.1 Oxysterol-binding protein [Dacryopinax primogenitus]